MSNKILPMYRIGDYVLRTNSSDRTIYRIGQVQFWKNSNRYVYGLINPSTGMYHALYFDEKSLKFADSGKVQLSIFDYIS